MSEQKQTRKSQDGSKDDDAKGAQQGDNATPGVTEKNDARRGGGAGAHDENA